MLLRFVAGMLSAGLMVLGADTASGQEYPNKPIRIITSGIGGASDLMARLIAQEISGPLGQQAIVDNRAGIIAVEAVAKAPPDGYSVLLYGSVIWIEPLMRDNVPWDPIRDFSPVTLLANSPNLIVVHPSLPVKSVKGLIALAKARPGQLNYASGGIGGTNHLAAELFKAMSGVNIVRINYKGSSPALNALIAGEVHLMFPTAGGAMSHLQAGRVRALAVTSAQPSALVPDVPTVAASGLFGYESVSVYGVFAPARTPATLINRLNREIVLVLNKTDVKGKFLMTGIEAVGGSPEQLAIAMKSEMARMGKVIRDAGIRGE